MLLSFRQDQKDYLPVCSVCNRVLVGELPIGMCKCIGLNCGICHASWGTNCPRCNSPPIPLPDLQQAAKETVKLICKSKEDLPDDTRGQMERCRSVRKWFDDAVAARCLGEQAGASVHSQQPPEVIESGESMVLAEEKRETEGMQVEESKEEQAERNPEVESKQVAESVADGFLPFEEIVESPSQQHCSFCQAYLSPDIPTGRCQHCGKVNYSRVRFSRDNFLASKWQCPNPDCNFRNVLSNRKCIECGAVRR